MVSQGGPGHRDRGMGVAEGLRAPGVTQPFLSPSPGTNMMMVGVHGPKTPCEEVYVKHMGNRVYNVTYTVKEKGDYILIVKWGWILGYSASGPVLP